MSGLRQIKNRRRPDKNVWPTSDKKSAEARQECLAYSEKNAWGRSDKNV